MSGASAGGSECRGLVLKLHLQKHYLLKNYTSRDLEIILDPNETFVELMPKDDPDALRMLRHADAQVASKYRSFLTFIRCEFLLLLPARLAATDRARAVAHKNMLAIENPTAAQKKQFASLLSSGAQLCLVTGTLARAKSFLGELYRPGESSSGASSLGASPGLSDEHRPMLENSSSEGSIHNRRGPRATQHRNSASAAVQVRQRSLDSPVEDPDYDNSKAHHVIAAAAASLTANYSHSSSPVPFVGSRKVLLECVAALLARSGGDQLIGALCNDVFKELHATLTDLAQSDRAKEFFASHADVFEVYGPLTQKRVRLVGSVDPALIAAGERYLAAHGSSVETAHPLNSPPSSQTSASTTSSSPPIVTSSSAGAWSHFAKRIKEAAAGGFPTPAAAAAADDHVGDHHQQQHQQPQQQSQQQANVQHNNNNNNHHQQQPHQLHMQQQSQQQQQQQSQQHQQQQQQQQQHVQQQQQQRTYASQFDAAAAQQHADEVALLNMFSPLDPARAAAVAAARSACRHRFAALSVAPTLAGNGVPAVCLLDTVAAVQQTAQAMRGAVVAIHLWRRRQPLAVAAVPLASETADDTQLISLLSLCVMAFTSGDAFVVDFQAEMAGDGDRSVAVACAHLLRDLVADESTTVLFSDAVRDATPLLSLRSGTRARIIDVRNAWSFLAELRERSALPQSALGSVQNVPSLSVLLEHFVGLPAAQRYVARLGAASAVAAPAPGSMGHVAWHEVRPLGAPALAAAAAEADGIAGVLRGLERQAAQLFLGVVRTTTQSAVNNAVNGSLAGGAGIGGGATSAAQSLALAPLVNLLLPVDSGSAASPTAGAGGAGNVYGSWTTGTAVADPMVALKAANGTSQQQQQSPSPFSPGTWR